MVKEFKLKQTGTEVILEGKSYFIDVLNPDVFNALLELDNIQKEVSELTVDSCDLHGLLSKLTNTADKILGKGSVAEIFKGRTVDFENSVNLLDFLIESSSSDLKKKKSKYKIDPIKLKR